MIKQIDISVNNTSITVTANKLRNLIAKIPEIDIECRDIAAENEESFDDISLKDICYDYLYPNDSIQEILSDAKQIKTLYTDRPNYIETDISFDNWRDDSDDAYDEAYITAVIASLIGYALANTDEISTDISIDTDQNNVLIAPVRKLAWEMTETEKDMTPETYQTALMNWVSALS